MPVEWRRLLFSRRGSGFEQGEVEFYTVKVPRTDGAYPHIVRDPGQAGKVVGSVQKDGQVELEIGESPPTFYITVSIVVPIARAQEPMPGIRRTQ